MVGQATKRGISRSFIFFQFTRSFLANTLWRTSSLMEVQGFHKATNFQMEFSRSILEIL